MGRLVWMVPALALASCAAAGGAAANAAVNTAIAATASGVSRAQGGCYSPCAEGTVCNRGTGLCDPLPCRGHCAADERCAPLPVEHCEPGTEVHLEVNPAPAQPERITPR